MPPKRVAFTELARPNPLRNKKPIIAPVAPQRQAAPKAALRPPKRACPNQECTTPDVQDGVCHSCGTIIDDSNIVSEVQFGETSSGAAVVQGSYVGADQGTARSLGPAFKRAGGMEAREATLREGRQMMQTYAGQLVISDVAINTGLQLFKLAAMNNFIQGRRMEVVTAVCLYSGCRAHPPCRVMLIDFADKIQVNVFKLGRTFKALHRTITLAADGLMPVLPEDLIWRFSNQLDFGPFTNKVAEDAIRIAQRMSLDWMVMGRRPSGVCGACIILAARMHNFRRTVTEVVYIVKVTTVTIQKRLEEFKITPSSTLTVDEFLNNEFLESAHDPPSFYEKTEEFQKTKKKRKRRVRTYTFDEDEEHEVSGDDSNKRQKTASPGPDQPMQTVELRRDADGFVIPPPPQSTQSEDIPIDPMLEDPTADPRVQEQTGESFEKLVEEFGDHPEVGALDEQLATSDPKANDKITKTTRAVHVPAEWEADEENLAGQISEIISAPSSIEHAESYARAHKYATEQIRLLDAINPPQMVSMDVHIGEDEFADDPEVVNCLLSPEDAAIKEQLWVNHNKTWLRQQQIKEWQKRQADTGPPKAKRNRKKKPRIGEGQTSPAASPADAAEAVLKARSFSKKINYDALRGMFDTIGKMAGQGYGSAATSRVTSRAGSDIDGSEVSRSAASSAAGDTESRDIMPLIQIPKSRGERYRERKSTNPRPSDDTAVQPPIHISDNEEENADDSDYIQPENQTRQVLPLHDDAVEDDDVDVEEEDYNANEMGDMSDLEGGFGDDEVQGFGANDGYDVDEDDYE